MSQRVGIVGLGLIGGSLGGALRRSGAWVQGYDRDVGNSRRAVERGLVDESAATVEAALEAVDIAVLATPARAIVDLLPIVDAAAPPHALLIDVGSVKVSVVEAMQRLHGAGRAVGGHPLAGDERSGPDAASDGLFLGKPFLLCPTKRTERTTMDRAAELARAVGAVPVEIDPQRHDEVLARTSHLPQILSTALALALRSGDRDFSGSGLRDMTRLASSDAAMWRDIVLLNKVEIAGALDEFEEVLTRIRRLIEAGEPEEFETLFNLASRAVFARSEVTA